jgi:septal ring factor EnvC (AmiA/AmiB activator)
MTFEEMERTMQFILEQQAQFAINMAKAEERMAESDERVARIEEIQENTARQIEHLGSALVELTEAHTRTQEALGELAEAQRHSDQRLDSLIDIVRGGRDTGQ